MRRLAIYLTLLAGLTACGSSSTSTPVQPPAPSAHRVTDWSSDKEAGDVVDYRFVRLNDVCFLEQVSGDRITYTLAQGSFGGSFTFDGCNG